MNTSELLEYWAEPHDPVEREFTKLVIEVRLAEINQATARNSLSWAKWTAIGTIAVAVIALGALVVSLTA